MCLACVVILHLKMVPESSLKYSQDLFASQVAKLPPMDRDEIIVATLTVTQLVLWCSRDATFPVTHSWSDIWGAHASYCYNGAVAPFCSFPLFSYRPSSGLEADWSCLMSCLDIQLQAKSNQH